MDSIFSKERKLLRKCLAHDNKAWARFVDEYHRLICNAIAQTLRKHSFPIENQIVDDLFQSVFLSLVDQNCKKLRQFKWNCKLSSWLHIISVRETIDFLRKQKDHSISLNGSSDQEKAVRTQLTNGKPNPGEQMEQEEEWKLFESIKNSLNPREQLFIELYYVRELPVAEVAKTLNITENYVYQLKSRIRDKMKNKLENIL